MCNVEHEKEYPTDNLLYPVVHCRIHSSGTPREYINERSRIGCQTAVSASLDLWMFGMTYGAIYLNINTSIHIFYL